MPRYYFNLRNDLTVDDPEGIDLPDIEAARETAASEAIQMAKVSLEETGRIDLTHHIQVTDAAGTPVLTVQFGDVVRIESGGVPVTL